MFTGIVAATGEVVQTKASDAERRIWLRSTLLADCDIGASVAVNGACLTVIDVDGDIAAFDVSAESLARSTLGRLVEGGRVNLERPVRVGDELGGHIVQGHVDGVGVIESVTDDADGRRLRIAVPKELGRYVVEKGSVTVDGVALTITACDGELFEVALVPHTLAVTTLGQAAPGSVANIEVDVLAKYVEKLTQTQTQTET